MKVPKTVSLDSLTDKQACRVARVPVKDKLSEFERPLDAAAFSCRARVPERAVVVPPSGCFLPNCSFTGSSLKEYSNHFRSTTHDLEALIEPLDKRVLDAITSWPLRIKEWKIASIEEGDIMGTDFFFAPAAFVAEEKKAAELEQSTNVGARGHAAKQAKGSRKAATTDRTTHKSLNCKSRNGVFMNPRPTQSLVDLAGSKAPGPIPESYLSRLAPPIIQLVSELAQVAAHVPMACNVIVNNCPLSLFGTVKLDCGTGDTFVCNTGAAIWALDWLVDSNVLAVGGFKTRDEHHVLGAPVVYPSNIQFWDASKGSMLSCMLHMHGCVWDLAWAPRNFKTAERTGFLAACFGDGKARVYDIPSSACGYFSEPPVLFEAEIPDTLLWRAAWSPDCTKIAFGCTLGTVSVWSVERGLLLYCFQAHDTALRSLQWCDSLLSEHFEQEPRCDIILTSGNDGKVCVWDVRDIMSSMMLFRARGISASLPTLLAPVNACKWSIEWNACIIQDNETVRWLRPGRSRSSSAASVDCTNGPGFWTLAATNHDGVVWDLDVSRMLPFSASAGSGGIVRISNLNRMGQRINKPLDVTAYRLVQAGKSDAELSFEFREDKSLSIRKNNKKMKAVDTVTVLADPLVAIHKIIWSRDPERACCIATGGSSGLLRIEDVS